MKSKITLTLITIILLIGITGCNGDNKKPTPGFDLKSTKENISVAVKTVETSKDEINKNSDNIEKEAVKIQKNVEEIKKAEIPEESKTVINPNLDNISTSSNNIIEQVKMINIETLNLEEAKVLLLSVQKDIINTEKNIEQIIKERDKEKELKEEAIKQKDSQLHKMLNYLVIGSIIFAGIFGIIFLITSNKYGILASIACIFIMIISIVVSTYLVYIAAIGGLLLIGLLIYGIWEVIKNRKALIETISTVETTKLEMSEESKNKIFGKGNDKGILVSSYIQSPSTVKLIQEIKTSMPTLLKYIKDYKETNGTTTNGTNGNT